MSGARLTRRQLVMAGALAMTAGGAKAHNGTIHIVVDKLAFTPKAVTARPGDTIEWVNKDRIAHTATVKGGWEVVVAPGKTGSRIVEAGDSGEYYCRFHPNMKGHITVEA